MISPTNTVRGLTMFWSMVSLLLMLANTMAAEQAPYLENLFKQ